MVKTERDTAIALPHVLQDQRYHIVRITTSFHKQAQIAPNSAQINSDQIRSDQQRSASSLSSAAQQRSGSFRTHQVVCIYLIYTECKVPHTTQEREIKYTLAQLIFTQQCSAVKRMRCCAVLCYFFRASKELRTYRSYVHAAPGLFSRSTELLAQVA